MGWVVSTTSWLRYPRKRPGTHCAGGCVGVGLVLMGIENLASLPRFDSWIIKPVTSHYADYAIPVTRID
jgi:hypothetical protein